MYAHAYPIDATDPSGSSILLNWSVETDPAHPYGPIGILELLYPANGIQILTFDTNNSTPNPAYLLLHMFNDTGTTWGGISVDVAGATIVSSSFPTGDIEDFDGIAGSFVGDFSDPVAISASIGLGRIGGGFPEMELSFDTFGPDLLVLTITVVPVPLPATIFLMGPVLLSLATFRRRRVRC
ncbi:MAG: hypothetical protein GY731_06175 [Gammaproteobacteria bacterium]|nr:hypothetical protein [Gammaproteobacteria bacterium]